MNAAGEKSLRSARKAKGAGHLRRGEILHAAERIFVREGYHGATIRKIADEVGLSSTALYMHFRDKSEILVEICENAFAQLIAQNDELAALPLEPAVRVRRMLEAYVQFGLSNPNTYLLVFSSPPGALTDGQLEAMNSLGMRSYGRFSEAMQDVAVAGRLRGGVALAVQTCWFTTHGLISLLLTQPRFHWTDTPEGLTKALLDTLFDGLLTA